MKIQGPNPILNAYQQQQKKYIDKKRTEQNDQLNISDAAKSLQKNQQHEIERNNFIQELKTEVKNDTYEINHEKLADKMIQFWKRD